MSEVPLLNHYKLKFVKRRLAQTLLGGLRIYVPQKVPRYIIVINVVLFFMPIVIGLPLSLLATFKIYKWQIGSYIAGVLFAFLVLFINMAATIFGVKRSSINPQNSSGICLDEENDVELIRCCHSSSTDYIFTHKTFKINIVIHAILAGLMMAGSVWFLNIKLLETLFGSIALASTLSAFGWLSLCIGLFSLCVMRPEEIAIYRTPDVFDELALSRSFHMAVCLVIHIVAQ